MADEGFEILSGCVPESECDRVLESCRAIPRSRAGARHLMSNPVVAGLARSTHLLAVARAWVGPRAVPFRATLFEKSSAANWLIPWHQDTALPLRRQFEAPGWGPWSEKAGVAYAHAPASVLERVVALRIQLDDAHAGNGPLRVIPSTHTCGVLTDDQIASCVREQPHHDCVAPRGAIVVMRPLLIHASSKARSDDPRRVLHIEYADSLQLAPGALIAVT